ncbi:hypothetical protein M9H77_22622 [Catharanthus roseus]|uniref:Uncharacterized protein n=1 Tax=Catharanthus roseus TaxID=4058 RepID=A0ACC0AT52_CATRO|nr:hypothetical protein M9H77_22622 [Catharanthus roseus]
MDKNRAKTAKTEAVGKATTLTADDRTSIKDFDLRFGDSRDDLRRHYLQGCWELKKEEQSRATNLGLIGVSSGSRNKEKETKWSENNENGSRRQSSSTYRGWQGNLPSTIGIEDGQGA